MHRIVQSVSESLTTGLKSHPHSERVMKDSGKELYLKDLTQQFEDDLGILDFKYVVDESGDYLFVCLFVYLLNIHKCILFIF